MYIRQANMEGPYNRGNFSATGLLDVPLVPTSCCSPLRPWVAARGAVRPRALAADRHHTRIDKDEHGQCVGEDVWLRDGARIPRADIEVVVCDGALCVAGLLRGAERGRAVAAAGAAATARGARFVALFWGRPVSTNSLRHRVDASSWSYLCVVLLDWPYYGPNGL